MKQALAYVQKARERGLYRNCFPVNVRSKFNSTASIVGVSSTDPSNHSFGDILIGSPAHNYLIPYVIIF